MSGFRTGIDREALGWLVRVNDPAFEAWEDWDVWMAADARHAEAYWRLAEGEGDAVEALKTAPAPTVRRVMSRRAFALPRSAMAAAFALVALGGVWFVWDGRPQPWTIETAPGEQRTVTLSDGSEVSLAGATRLTLDRRRPRDVSLDAGRALFEVTHDEAHPFIVEVGDSTLTDLGTTFDVTRLENGARVSVSEGSVRVETQDATATLNPGDSVVAGAGGIERRSVAVEDVAGWREGRLAYTGETLQVVAQDLSRALNRPISVSSALAERRFSGSLTTTTDAAHQKARLGRLLGVSIVEDGEGWRLEP